MIILGIDPGESGGLAAMEGHHVEVHAFKGATEKEILNLCRIRSNHPARAYMEAVHSFPGQGVASSFKFGQHYGGLRMAVIASGIPLELVSPMKWKKAMGLVRRPNETMTAYKNRSKAMAEQLFPSVKVTHAVAEALLLSEYGRRQP